MLYGGRMSEEKPDIDIRRGIQWSAQLVPEETLHIHLQRYPNALKELPLQDMEVGISNHYGIFLTAKPKGSHRFTHFYTQTRSKNSQWFPLVD